MTLRQCLEAGEGGSVADEVGEGEEVKEEAAKATKLCISSKKIKRRMLQLPKVNMIPKRKHTHSSTPKLSTEDSPQFQDPRAPQMGSVLEKHLTQALMKWWWGNVNTVDEALQASAHPAGPRTVRRIAKQWIEAHIVRNAGNYV